MALTSEADLTKLARRHPGILFQGSAKVALVGESRAQSDVDNSCIRIQKCATGRFDPKLPQIVPHTTEISFAKRSCQMDRMNSCAARQFAQRDRFLKPCMEDFRYVIEPSISTRLWLRFALPEYFRQKLHCQTLNGKSRRGIII